MCVKESMCICLNMYILTHLFIVVWLTTPAVSCEVLTVSRPSFICRGKIPSSVYCMDLVFTILYQLYALLTSTGILGEGTAGREMKVSTESVIPFADKECVFNCCLTPFLHIRLGCSSWENYLSIRICFLLISV